MSRKYGSFDVEVDYWDEGKYTKTHVNYLYLNKN